MSIGCNNSIWTPLHPSIQSTRINMSPEHRIFWMHSCGNEQATLLLLYTQSVHQLTNFNFSLVLASTRIHPRLTTVVSYAQARNGWMNSFIFSFLQFAGCPDICVNGFSRGNFKLNVQPYWMIDGSIWILLMGWSRSLLWALMRALSVSQLEQHEYIWHLRPNISFHVLRGFRWRFCQCNPFNVLHKKHSTGKSEYWRKCVITWSVAFRYTVSNAGHDRQRLQSTAVAVLPFQNFNRRRSVKWIFKEKGKQAKH